MPPPVVGLASPAASPTASDAVGVGALHRRQRQQLQPRADRASGGAVALGETARSSA